jgi:hypothetical protein
MSLAVRSPAAVFRTARVISAPVPASASGLNAEAGRHAGDHDATAGQVDTGCDLSGGAGKAEAGFDGAHDGFSSWIGNHCGARQLDTQQLQVVARFMYHASAVRVQVTRSKESVASHASTCPTVDDVITNGDRVSPFVDSCASVSWRVGDKDTGS